MDSWHVLLMRRRARRDKRAEVYQPRPRVAELTGTHVVFEPERNLWHADIADNMNTRGELADVSDDLRRGEDELARHGSPAILSVGLVLALMVEVVASIQVTKSMGLPPAERGVLGLSLACGIFALTFWVNQNVKDDSLTGRRRTLFRLGLAAYAFVLLAVSAIRAQEALAIGDDQSLVFTMASSVVTVILSIGPAWIAEGLMTKLAVVTPIRRQIRNDRRRLGLLERSREGAKRQSRRFGRTQAEVERRRTLLRAGYDAEYGRHEGSKNDDTKANARGDTRFY